MVLNSVIWITELLFFSFVARWVKAGTPRPVKWIGSAGHLLIDLVLLVVVVPLTLSLMATRVRETRELQQGPLTTATVISRFYGKQKNSEMFEVKYTFQTHSNAAPSQTITRTEEVTEQIYDQAPKGARLPVRYLPASPQFATIEDNPYLLGDLNAYLGLWIWAIIVYVGWAIALLYDWRHPEPPTWIMPASTQKYADPYL